MIRPYDPQSNLEPTRAFSLYVRQPMKESFHAARTEILVATTQTLRPYRRLLPIGFQSGFKTYIASTIFEIDRASGTIVWLRW